MKKLTGKLCNLAPILVVFLAVFMVYGAVWLVVSVENQREEMTLKHEEFLMEQCVEVIGALSDIDHDITELNAESHQNVLAIYSRIMEIKNESPNEIRDKVIDSIDINSTPLTLKASVLSLLQVYPELQEDIQIQTFLQDNVTILGKIEQKNTEREKWVELLGNYIQYVENETEELMETETE